MLPWEVTTALKPGLQSGTGQKTSVANESPREGKCEQSPPTTARVPGSSHFSCKLRGGQGPVQGYAKFTAELQSLNAVSWILIQIGLIFLHPIWTAFPSSTT